MGENAINMREKKMTMAFQTELAEEANARSLLAGDCSRITDHVREVNTKMVDEIAKLNAALARVTSKHNDDVNEVKDLITMEKTTRERVITGVKNDVVNRQRSTKENYEEQIAETAKESKAGFSQLTLLLENHRAQRAMDMESYQIALVDVDKRTQNRFDDDEVASENKFQQVWQQLDYRFNKLEQSMVNKFESLETEQTTTSVSLKNELGAERLRREKDEAAIIEMVERMMQQVAAAI